MIVYGRLPREPLNELDARYQKWMSQWPHLFEMIEKRALEHLHAGRAFSVKRIVEDLRWDDPRTWDCAEGFKWCNTYSAYVTRDLIEKHPLMKGLVETRKVKGEV